MQFQARLIDLTRSTSRLGRGAMTGIDRVEYLWLQELLRRGGPLFALVRTRPGFLLLDRNGALALAGMLERGATPPEAGFWRRLLRQGDLRARAEAAVRGLAVARAPVPFLARMLKRHLPPQTSYLNLGHTNLTPRVMAAVKAAGGRVTVLVHDTIPLDHPEFTREGIAPVFRRKLAAVSAGADLVVHSTQDAKRKTDRWLTELGRVPLGMVAPFGVEVAAPDPAALPGWFDRSQPYVVALGTVEPRKNHALLLDVWEARGPHLPRLVIVGGRGWAEPALFDRIAQAGARGDVVWLQGLGDGAVTALLQGARALVFPSLAEGFGLPPLEAAALGTPVVASDLPVIRELLGNLPVYLDPRDIYSWAETIADLKRDPETKGRTADGRKLPQWKDHFNAVLSLA